MTWAIWGAGRPGSPAPPRRQHLASCSLGCTAFRARSPRPQLLSVACTWGQMPRPLGMWVPGRGEADKQRRAPGADVGKGQGEDREPSQGPPALAWGEPQPGLGVPPGPSSQATEEPWSAPALVSITGLALEHSWGRASHVKGWLPFKPRADPPSAVTHPSHDVQPT